MRRFDKDPNAVKPYGISFVNRLQAGETITSHEVEISDGPVVIDSHSESGGIVTIWFSGGAENVAQRVTAHIVTSMGVHEDGSIIIRGKSQ